MAERSPRVPGDRPPGRPLLVLAGAWVLLNVFLAANPWQPGLQWLAPSPEAWALLAILALLARREGSPKAIWPLVALAAGLRLFGLADDLVPAYLNRPFNLYLDLGYLPGLAHLLAHSFPPGRLALLAAGALLAAAGILWALGRILQAAHGALTHPTARRCLAGAGVLLALLVAGREAGWAPPASFPAPVSRLPRLAEEAGFLLRVAAIRREGLAAVALAEAWEPAHPAPLARLAGRDVHLFVVESYGQTLFAHPRLREGFAGTAEAFRRGLEAQGFHMVSAFLGSPTFGGASWLAFGTLETGVRLSDQLRYGYVLSSRVRPLADYFNRAGYRSVSVMPGTTMPWPEGGYFAYERSYFAWDLGYRGPAFGWSPMPDQFALHRIHQEEILPRRQPLFVRYVLTSTHAPFNRLPPYLEDWSAMGDGGVFHRLEPRTFPVNWPDLSNADGAYLAAMAYEFQVLEGFLGLAAAGGALAIVVGDHQPVAHIAGDHAPWLVPVHLISRDRGLLARFEALGYSPGVRPREDSAPAGMEDFMRQLFTVSGGEE